MINIWDQLLIQKDKVVVVN